jgi:tetratricopeptide (TPR) repeat protein
MRKKQMLNKLIRLVAVTLSIITLIVYTQALMQDRMLVKALFTDVSNEKNYSNILNGLPYYQHIEKAAVKLFNNQINSNQLNCDQLKLWGNKLTEINKRNPQGYYLLTSCAEAEKNDKKAIELIKSAIKYDPLNTQYLLGAAILYLNSGDLVTSELYLQQVGTIDPKTFNLDKIVAALNQKKLQETPERTSTK